MVCKDLLSLSEPLPLKRLKGLTLRIRDSASKRKPLMALPPRTAMTPPLLLDFLPLLSPSASTTKNGPIAIYTAWIMMLSLIAIESAPIKSLILGNTDEIAWKTSLASRRCTLSEEASCMNCRRMPDVCASLGDASTNG